MKLSAILRIRPIIHATLCAQVLLLALAVSVAVAAWAADVAAASDESTQEASEPPVLSQQEELALSLEGKATYQRYCRNCHGEEAHGDGPVAEFLRVPPSDLTRLSQKNDGRFPFDAVERAIDGRAEMRTHGMQEMPIWGDALRAVDTGPEEEARVRQKIREVVYFLKSLQQED